MIQYINEPFEDSESRGYSTPGWYFWDEAGVNCYGPYTTPELAAIDAGKYADSL